MCPSTCFSRTNCSLNVYKIKSNYNPRFIEKSTLLRGTFNNYKEKLSVPRVQTTALILKPGLHIVVIVVSTVANMFLTLFQAVLIHVNISITTSQA